MTTPRYAYKIDTNNPGSDLAGETAAAMAAASIIFKDSNPTYSNELLNHAKQVCLDSNKCRLFALIILKLSRFILQSNVLFNYCDYLAAL